jgi:hypothetical protein
VSSKYPNNLSQVVFSLKASKLCIHFLVPHACYMFCIFHPFLFNFFNSKYFVLDQIWSGIQFDVKQLLTFSALNPRNIDIEREAQKFMNDLRNV